MRVIVLDTFPLTSTGKREPDVGSNPTTLHRCQNWIYDCLSRGNRVLVPAISYYEALRELERLGAASQIARMRAFCRAIPDRYLPLKDADLELAAKLWADIRNAGLPTARNEALDRDVILAAQTLSVGLPLHDVVVATSNSAHLSRFVPAQLWSDILP
jgi:predicted nucleic acid-binding protein